METVLEFIFALVSGIFWTWSAWLLGRKDTNEKFPAEGEIISLGECNELDGSTSYNVMCIINGEKVRALTDLYYGPVLNLGEHIKVLYYYNTKRWKNLIVEIQDERLKPIDEDEYIRKYIWATAIIAIAFYAVAFALFIKIIN